MPRGCSSRLYQNLKNVNMMLRLVKFGIYGYLVIQVLLAFAAAFLFFTMSIDVVVVDNVFDNYGLWFLTAYACLTMGCGLFLLKYLSRAYGDRRFWVITGSALNLVLIGCPVGMLGVDGGSLVFLSLLAGFLLINLALFFAVVFRPLHDKVFAS